MKMKHIIAMLAGVTGSAMAQSTWFYGASNNSANFGVNPTSSQAITWMDAWAGGSSKDLSYFGNGSGRLQSNTDSFADDQSIMMFGFGGLGLTSSQVDSASLYLRQDFSFPTGTPNTWTIVGIAAGNSNWDTSAMSWNDINGATAGDWTGGTLLGSLTGNYGTFQDLGTSVDGNLSINITAALKAYLDGTISGIAFVNSTNNGTFSGNDNAFIPYSDDNGSIATNRPGLLVTAIPEPSSALLGLLATMGFVLRRRR
jgi:hypothetical protein